MTSSIGGELSMFATLGGRNSPLSICGLPSDWTTVDRNMHQSGVPAGADPKMGMLGATGPRSSVSPKELVTVSCATVCTAPHGSWIGCRYQSLP